MSDELPKPFKNEVTFTIMPYLSLLSHFKFGEFDLWPDTKENWLKFLEIERPVELLGMYVDGNGNTLNNKIVITTKKQFNAERLKTLVSALFFIPSTRYYFKLSSDNFYYETFISKQENPHNTVHSRIDKFSRTIIATEDYKIYRPNECEYSKYELKDLEKKYFDKLRKMFADSKFNYVFKSLNFYLRTQYKSLSLFPEIEDIQNFCTAFEIFFKVEDQNGIGEVIANHLYRYYSLAEKDERAELKDWFIELYKLRSDYTHGKDIHTKRLIFKETQRQIDVAKQIYTECINKLLKPQRGVGRRILSNDQSLLISLFTSQKVFDDIVSILTTSYGKSQLSGTNNLKYLNECEEKELGRFWGLSYKFILNVNKRTVKVINPKRLKSAMQSCLAIIDFLCDRYVDPKYKDDFNVEIIQQLRSLPLFPKDSNDWDIVYRTLDNPHLEYTKMIGSLDDFQNATFKRELSFRDVIDISLIAHVFTDLYEVERNYRLGY